MSDGAGRPRAAIHDLGYKRYVGTRRPQSTRWQVIVRNLVAMSWRGWWQVKLWLLGAAFITIGVGVPMYISRHEIFENALGGGGLPLTWSDALIPISYRFYPWVAFVVSLTVLSGVVARDLRAGAFEFYFSRPVRPIDYVIGKVGGAAVLMSFFLLVGPLLLSLFRVGLSRSTDELMTTLIVVPKTLLIGAVSTLAFAVVPLAFSALSSRPRNTIVAWAAFYLMVGGTALGLSVGLEIPALAALDLGSAINGFALGLFGVTFLNFSPTPPPLWACMAALLGYAAVSVVILWWRLRAAQRAGLGGG